MSDPSRVRGDRPGPGDPDRPAPPGSRKWVAGPADRDPGLQPERTRLAWRRTTLSWSVVTVLAVRQALREHGGAGTVTLTSVATLAFVAFLLLAHLRIQRLDTPRPPVLSARAAAAVVGCAVVLAACGVALLR
jgi:hypothetical protein